jgi:hypothetical protein
MEESKQSEKVTGLLAQDRNSLRKGKQQKTKIREEIFNFKRFDLRGGQRITQQKTDRKYMEIIW